MSKAEETTLNYNFHDDVKGKKKKRNRKSSEKMSVFGVVGAILILGSTMVSELTFKKIQK